MPVRINIELIGDSVGDCWNQMQDIDAPGGGGKGGGKGGRPSKADTAAKTGAENATAAAGGIHAPAPAGGAAGAAVDAAAMRAAVTEVDTKLGRPKAEALLAKFDAKKISAVKPEYYAALVLEANAMLGKASPASGNDSLD